MASGGDGDAGDRGCPSCRALAAQLEELRREVARLRARNAELLASAAERDFERPPHYQ